MKRHTQEIIGVVFCWMSCFCFEPAYCQYWRWVENTNKGSVLQQTVAELAAFRVGTQYTGKQCSFHSLFLFYFWSKPTLQVSCIPGLKRIWNLLSPTFLSCDLSFYAFLRLFRDLLFLLIYFILATVTDFVSTITSACYEVDAVGTQEETLEGLREGFIKTRPKDFYIDAGVNT